MTTFTLRNLYKKSAIETETWVKVAEGETKGKIVTVETGWRWAEFELTTDDGEIPDLDLVNEGGVNPYHLMGEGNIEEVEFYSADDGVSFEVESDDLTEEELEVLHEEIEEESHYDVLERQGYVVEETEIVLHGPLVVFDKDGNEVARGEEE